MYPGKVSWGSGDHSAITTSQSGVYKSKWNEWPLMEHNWDDTPFGTTNLKYYVSTNISGSFSILCNNSTRSFSVRNIPDADYDWSVGSGLTLNSDGNYNTSVTANSFYSGETWIEVEITSPLGGSNEDVKTSKKITFWVGPPTVSSITGCSSIPPANPCTYYAEISDWDSSPTNYYWATSPSNGVSITSYGHYASITFTNEGAYQVVAKAQNTCGWGSYAMKMVMVRGGYRMSISPNPATEEAVISIESVDGKSLNPDNEWDLEVYTQGQLLKEKKQKLKGTSYKLKTSGWKEGVYILKVNYKGNELHGKLLVR